MYGNSRNVMSFSKSYLCLKLTGSIEFGLKTPMQSKNTYRNVQSFKKVNRDCIIKKFSVK